MADINVEFDRLEYAPHASKHEASGTDSIQLQNLNVSGEVDLESNDLVDDGTTIWDSSQSSLVADISLADDSIGLSELDLSIAPTWTGQHSFDVGLVHDRLDVSSDVSTDGSSHYSVDSSANPITVTLSSADAIDGKEMHIKRNGGNSVTIDTEGSETVEDSSSIELSVDNEAVTIVYNSTNSDWEVF